MTIALLLAGLWAGAASAATGKSAAFSLDLTEGDRVSAGSEELTFSNLWDGDEDATVTIRQDGAAIFNGLTGEGVKTWSVNRNGRYVLTHTTYTNGAPGKVEIAVFVVEGKDVPVSELSVEWESTDGLVYDGNGKTPGVTAKDGEKSLVEGVDYTVRYEGNTNAGTAKAILTGLPPYVGSVTNEFAIAKRLVELTSGTASKAYDGMPLVCHSVTTNGDGFVSGEGVDFTFTGSQTIVGSSKNTFDYMFKAGTQAGNYAITKTEGDLKVTSGEIVNPFDPDDPFKSVTPEALAKANCITNYDGDGHSVEVAAFLNPLIAANNPQITYSLLRDGTYEAQKPVLTNVVSTSVWYRIEADNFKPFTTNALLVISPRSIENIVVEAIGDLTYTGSGIEPIPAVTDMRTLVGMSEPTNILTSADYDLSYLNNTNVGTAKIVLSGKNNYEGSQTNTFQIVPAIIPPGPDGAIVATGYTNAYDGAAHGVSVSVTGLRTQPTVQYKGSPSAVWRDESPTYTDVCDTQVWWKVSAPNYQPVEGTVGLKIVPRPVTLTSGTKTDFAYNGQPHAYTNLTVTAGAFVAGEGIATSNWATVTAVSDGEVSNTFDYAPLAGTKLSNYNLTVVTGKIAVVKSAIQEELEKIFDVANTATVVEPMCDANGVFAGYKVILGKDYGPVALSNDFGAVTIDLNGWTIRGMNGVNGTTTTAGGNGGAAITIAGTCGAAAGATSITVKDDSYSCVQLWKSGPYFAARNVGATKPEECGYYFWWGDTVGYVRNESNDGWVSAKDAATSIEFSPTNAPANSTYGKTIGQLYNDGNGYIDVDSADGKLKPEYDAATAYWGAPWRMATKAELDAFQANCTAVWTNNWNGTGVNGCLVTGKASGYTDKSIFLPAAGYGSRESSIKYFGTYGSYWSSTPVSDNSDFSWALDFESRVFTPDDVARYCGQSVRPVRDFAAAIIGGNGGDGNPAGNGSLAVVDATGAEVAVFGLNGLVTNGVDGVTLLPDVVAMTEFTYDGTEKRPVAATNVYIFAGDICATNVDTYTLKITPVEGYAWGDGSTTTTNIAWKIVKGDLPPGGDPDPTDPSVDPDDPGQRDDPTIPFSAFDYVGMYDGEAHTIDTNAMKAAYKAVVGNDFTVSFARCESGGPGGPALPWVDEPVTLKDVGVTSFWYKVTSANYADVVKPCKVAVTNRCVTLTSGSKTDFVYDGNPHAYTNLTVTAGSFVAGDGIATSNWATVSDVSEGEVPNTFDYEPIEGTLLSNYDITVVTGLIAVAQAENVWTVEPAIDGWTYGEAAKTPVGAAKFGEVSFTYDPATVGAAGDYTLTASVAGTANYTGLTTNLTFTISKATVPQGDDPDPIDPSVDPTDPEQREDPDVRFSAFDYVGVYDGEAHTVDTNALKQAYETVFGETITIGFMDDASGAAGVRALPPIVKDAGVTSFWYKVSSANFNDIIHPCKIAVTNRLVTLTSGSKTDFVYDGNPHAYTNLTVTAGSFVAGEGIATSNWATVTAVSEGEVDNAFDYEALDGTLLSNYDLTVVTGKIAVVKGALPPGDDPDPTDPSVDPDDPGQREAPDVRFSAYDYVGVYDGEVHTIDTNALKAAYEAALGEGASCMYARAQDGEWTAEPVALRDVGVTSFWYKVTSVNYADVVKPCKVAIAARDIAQATIASIPDVVLGDGPAMPVPVVTDGTPSIITANDYTVSYLNNAKPGTATVTLTGKGNYTGTKSANFTIKAVGVKYAALKGSLAWKLNTGTGCYTAQLKLTCTNGFNCGISDLKFVYQDRMNGTKVASGLWDSSTRVYRPTTTIGGTTYRYVALDASKISAQNVTALYGVQDVSKSVGTVPTAQCTIELFVGNLASPVSDIGYVMWKSDGAQCSLPISAAGGSQGMTVSQAMLGAVRIAGSASMLGAPLSTAALNASLAMGVAIDPASSPYCKLTDFGVTANDLNGRVEVGKKTDGRESKGSLGANACVVLMGAKNLTDGFAEIGSVPVDESGAFYFYLGNKDYQFFRVRIDIQNVVE